MVETAQAFGFDSPPSLAAGDELAALAPPAPSLGEIESDVALGESSIGQGQVLATPLRWLRSPRRSERGVRHPTSIVKTSELRPDHGAGRGDVPGDGAEGRGHDARGRSLGNQHRRPDPGVQVAGKSGTAELGPAALEPGQVLAPGEDPPQEENAWFATYAPADKPELAIAVMLINKSGGGGTVAAPIAREIYLNTCSAGEAPASCIRARRPGSR